MGVLEEKLRKEWPEFEGVFHNKVKFTGNPSAASTGSLISAGIHSQEIKKGQLIVIVTFGSGLSIGIYAFYA